MGGATLVFSRGCTWRPLPLQNRNVLSFGYVVGKFGQVSLALSQTLPTFMEDGKQFSALLDRELRTTGTDGIRH